jgi:drug/metabolite transporter (DMT)-like permease
MQPEPALDHTGSRPALIDRHPLLGGVGGAMCIAFAGIFVALAAVSPATAAFFRCLYALPILGFLAYREDRAYGPRSRHNRLLAATAGVFFAADLVSWHYAIEFVGAGLGTVLANLQVVVVAFVAWRLLGERPDRRIFLAIPILLSGVVLISGVVGEGAYGSDPLLGVVFGIGTSIAYAGFILLLRQSSKDLRRPAGPLTDATAVAALASMAAGFVIGDLDMTPGWPAQGWLVLLALTAQVAGWLLITVSLPRLPAVVTSMVLVLQPLATLMLGAWLLGERPSAAQLAGCGLVLVGVLIGTAGRRPAEG